MRTASFSSEYKPQFSGHETFPLRYGWLKKAYDQIVKHQSNVDNKFVFLSDDAIGRFGVGKNMVSSIRHWAMATQILEEDPDSRKIMPTALGKKLFGKGGFDPYMEHPASIWLIHWQLASYRKMTAWFWLFNLCPEQTFDRNHLTTRIHRLIEEQGWRRAGSSTIKNDLACLIRTYVPHTSALGIANDDKLESPLTELELLRPVGSRDGFRLVRGPKNSLGSGVFIYALLDYWSRESSGTSTLSLEAITHAPCSPGRVFLLSEIDVIHRLAGLERLTGGDFRWSETAGLKQVMRSKDTTMEDALSYVDSDYEHSGCSAAGPRR